MLAIGFAGGIPEHWLSLACERRAAAVCWQAEPIVRKLDCRAIFLRRPCVPRLRLIPAPPFRSRALSTLRALVCIGHPSYTSQVRLPTLLSAVLHRADTRDRVHGRIAHDA